MHDIIKKAGVRECVANYDTPVGNIGADVYNTLDDEVKRSLDRGRIAQRQTIGVLFGISSNIYYAATEPNRVDVAGRRGSPSRST